MRPHAPQCATDEFEALEVEAYREALGIEAWSALERLPLVRVQAVGDGSPLEEGDLLWRVGDTLLAEPTDVAWALRDVEAGEVVELTLRRRGEETTVDVTLREFLTSQTSQHTYQALHMGSGEP